MSVGKIQRHGFGALSADITLPFTAPSDGILIFQTNPSSSTGAYATIIIDNNSNQRIQLTTPNGTGAGSGASIPIKKGQTARATLSNCTLSTKSFLPLF